MPHYVTQLEADNEFAIYSTIVDGLLTPPMTATEMRRWLVSNDYKAWLQPYDPEQIIEQWWLDNDGMAKLTRDQARFHYWHTTNKRDKRGFGYVKLSDAYFVLPRECWRNGR